MARVASPAVNPALRQRLRSATFIPFFVITLSFVVMLSVSWRRWLSPLTDSGREMDLPLRLLNGELLYRDIHYLYAPFSPYFNALLYWIWGVHLDVLQASGILGSAVAALLVFRIARRMLGPLDATIAVLCVIVWLIFKPYGNLISPYSYAALHATIFALGALLCCLRFNESSRTRDLLAAAALTGLAGIAKLEFAIPAVTAVATAVLITGTFRRRVIARRIVIALVPFLVITASVYGWFFSRIGWETLVVDCHIFYTHLPDSLIVYNAWRAGTNRPLASIAEVVGGLAVCAIIACGALIIAHLRIRIRGAGKVSFPAHAGRNALLFLLIASLTALAIGLTTGGWDGSPMRAAPVLLFAVIIYISRKGLRGEEHNASLLIVAVFSLVMLLRVALRVPSGGPYGGFLLPTTYLLFYYLLVRGMPAAIVRLGYPKAVSEQARRVARSLVLAVLAVGAGDTMVRYLSKYRFWVSAPRGHLRVVQAHSPAYQEALDYLREHSTSADRIAVFPEGSDLAFLSERRIPLRHQILLPGLVSEADEKRMIAQLASEPIRFVLIVNRPTREFGAEAFGRDYCQDLGDAIEREYAVVRVCGRDRNPQIEIGDREFFIKILERKS